MDLNDITQQGGLYLCSQCRKVVTNVGSRPDATLCHDDCTGKVVFHALAALRAPEGGTHGCKVTKEFTCELDPETVRAMRPPPTPPPVDLVAMVQEWRIAQAAWIEEETDATANRLGKAEHALLAWTPAAPVPAQAGEPTRPTPACAAHDILACEVCMTDEAFAAPQEPPTIEIDDIVTLLSEDDDGDLGERLYMLNSEVIQVTTKQPDIDQIHRLIWRRPALGAKS